MSRAKNGGSDDAVLAQLAVLQATVAGLATQVAEVKTLLQRIEKNPSAGAAQGAKKPRRKLPDVPFEQLSPGQQRRIERTRRVRSGRCVECGEKDHKRADCPQMAAAAAAPAEE